MAAGLSALRAVFRPDGGETSAWDVLVTVWVLLGDQLLDGLSSPSNCAAVMEQVAFVKSGDGPRLSQEPGKQKGSILVR